MSSGFTPTEFAELLASSVLGGSMTGGLLVYIYIRCERRKRHRQHDVETCESGVGESQVSDTDPIDSQRESNFIPIQDPPSYEIPTSSLSNYGSNSGMRSVDDSSHLDRILYPTPLHPHMLIHPTINRWQTTYREHTLSAHLVQHSHCFYDSDSTALYNPPFSKEQW